VGGFAASALTLASRLEWTPQIYHLFDAQQYIEQQQRKLQDAQLQGATKATVRGTRDSVEIDDVLARLDTRISTVKGKIDEIDNGAELKYKVHRYGFLFGLLAILFARAWPPVLELLGVS